MPRLDGFQLIARIRREAILRGLPIVVLSSRTSQAVRDRALAAGTNVLLPKSRHRRSLVAAVTACPAPDAAVLISVRAAFWVLVMAAIWDDNRAAKSVTARFLIAVSDSPS